MKERDENKIHNVPSIFLVNLIQNLKSKMMRGKKASLALCKIWSLGFMNGSTFLIISTSCVKLVSIIGMPLTCLYMLI